MSHQANTPVASDPTLRPHSPPPKVRHLPPWKVLLHNDDVNDGLYVTETIYMLTPLSLVEARDRMQEADHGGVSLILTTHKERAELYQDQFQSKRLTVTIEAGD